MKMHEGPFPIRVFAAGLVLALTLPFLLLLTACGADSMDKAAQPSATSAAATVAKTTTAPAAATIATTTSTTRSVAGPAAQNAQLTLRTGETRIVTGISAGSELVFIWTEVENLTDKAYTVSSILSMTLSDAATGAAALSPNVPGVITQLMTFDKESKTLDGEVAAHSRLSGWTYGEFPAGIAKVRMQIVLTGADAAQTEPVTVDVTVR